MYPHPWDKMVPMRPFATIIRYYNTLVAGVDLESGAGRWPGRFFTVVLNLGGDINGWTNRS